MSKFQVWAGGVLLSFILGVMGFPWLYRQYLVQTTKQVIEKSGDYFAIKQLEFCALVPIENNYHQIEKCTTFFTDYVPKKSKGFKQGDPFPFSPLGPAQITNAYALLTQARKRLKLEPLPPLSTLSHGSLELSIKNNEQ